MEVSIGQYSVNVYFFHCQEGWFQEMLNLQGFPSPQPASLRQQACQQGASASTAPHGASALEPQILEKLPEN